jgi:Cu/Ag efflux protein CusF
VDKAGGKLTVSHDALPNGMPAMTMAFKVKDASWLDKVKSGQKIRFASDNINGAMTIVRLELPK